jgi:hypothetical protein
MLAFVQSPRRERNPFSIRWRTYDPSSFSGVEFTFGVATDSKQVPTLLIQGFQRWTKPER